MEAWVGEIGVWAVFEVMTMIAQVMKLVARPAKSTTAPELVVGFLIVGLDSRDSRSAPGSRTAVRATPNVDLSQRDDMRC